MKKSILEKLDVVLEIYLTIDSKLLNQDALFNKLFANNTINNLAELTQILHKLDTDGYLTPADTIEVSHLTGDAPHYEATEVPTYMLSFDGEFFIENGGYTGKIKREKYFKWFNIAAIFFAIWAGLPTGIYYGIQIWKFIHHLLICHR